MRPVIEGTVGIFSLYGGPTLFDPAIYVAGHPVPVWRWLWNVATRYLSSTTQHRQPSLAGDQRQLLTVIPVPQYTTHAFGLGALSPGG